MVFDPFSVVVPHEGHVAHHPGDFACELGHGVFVHLRHHGLAVFPGLVQLAAFGEGTDKGPVRADDERGALGELLAEPDRLRGVFDGGGQLPLAVADGGEHLAGADAEARRFGGHRVLQ